MKLSARVLVAGSIACALIAAVCTAFYFNENKEYQFSKFLPQEGEEGEDHDKLRELWWNAMHRAAPGTDWKQIELQNDALLLTQKNEMRKNFGAPGVLDESFANGKITGQWSERGSNNIAGSTIGVDYVPETNMIYTITSGGSLWKGKLDGTQWTVLNDDIVFSNNEVSAFQKPGGGVRVLTFQYSTGLMYSDDDGKTFTRCGGKLGNTSQFFESYLKRIFVADDAARTVYAEVYGYDYLLNTNVVTLFKSLDAGKTFNEVDVAQVTDSDNTSAHKPYNSNDVFTVFVSAGSAVTTKVSGGTVTKKVAFASGIMSPCNLKAVNIGGAVTLYLLINNVTVFRSTDEGTSWTKMGTLPFSSWGRFDVSNTNATHLFAGAVNAIRSYNSGATWVTVNEWYEYYNNIPGKLHADIMEIKQFKKQDGTPFAIINNHGGCAVSYDDITTTNNLTLTGLYNGQFYDVLTNPLNTDQIFIGTQDQGWQLAVTANTPGILNMTQQISGDYGHLAMSENHKHLWSEYPGGWILYYNDPLSTSISSSWTMPGTAKPVYGWILPTAELPGSENAVLMAGGNINGGDGSYLVKVEALNAYPYTITPTQYNYEFRSHSNQGWGGISAINASSVDAGRLYVGAEDGTFFYSEDNGTTWNKSTLNGPGPWYLYGNSIYSSKNVSKLVWYAGSGYSNPAVYESTDGGKTFTAISTGLPNTLVFEICANADETLLFAGTEAGPYVYVREDKKWYSLTGAATPLQSYTSVEYIPSLNTVRFGTFGRGVWDFKITSLVLPITLTNFSAALQNKNAVLNWTTANETNTSHYNIQRSFDGKNFTAIAKQSAAGTSASQHSYTYTDANVTALNKPIIYYGLQITDKNNSVAYSKIVQLNFSANNAIAFAMYPNPASTTLHLTISGAENKAMNIRITDMNGRQVYAEKISNTADVFNHDINLSSLQKGTYIIEIISAKGNSKAKFVKE